MRHLQVHPRELGFVHPFELAAEAGHVGGRAAHVEADDRAAGFLPPDGARKPHHTAGGTGQDRLAAGENLGPDQSAVGAHEKQIRLPVLEPRAKSFPIIPEERREVSVDAGGLAPVDDFDAGHGFRGKRHLAKPELLRQRADFQLVRGEGVGVHQHHRQSLDSIFK